MVQEIGVSAVPTFIFNNEYAIVGAETYPAFQRMMEHLGYAFFTETPCVWVDVQRGGPSTGLPTLPAQQDMMQVKWGSHGDYDVIALSPNSPQPSRAVRKLITP